MLTKNRKIIPSSFRDPSGSLFQESGVLYRKVNPSYRHHYDLLIDSGLYANLVNHNLLIPHIDAHPSIAYKKEAYKVIQPEKIEFISYPHEWCFSQLKNAALATLEIQNIAIQHGMTLKDASAYNVQFKNGKPILIDTLSFEQYEEGKPWVAYRQFCQHFLAPLALMSYKDYRLNQLWRVFIDGIPLDLASKLLPWRTFLRPSMDSHIHLHAKAQRYFSKRRINPDRRFSNFGRQAFLGLIDNLRSTILPLNWANKKSEWIDYYREIHYSIAAQAHKKRLVADALAMIKPRSVWDLGANTGIFSRLASDQAIMTVSFDIDHCVVERIYHEIVERKELHILPLLFDISNPTPNFGWANQERMSLQERGPAGAVLALAIMHHLRIGNNVPLEYLARFLAQISRWLLIEFIPKNDVMVQRLLSNRKDIYLDYCQDIFEKVFTNYFNLRNKTKIYDSQRHFYLFQKRES
jgi:hypothetical protein